MPKNRQSSGFGFGSIADRKYRDPDAKAVLGKGLPNNIQADKVIDVALAVKELTGAEGLIAFGLRSTFLAEAEKEAGGDASRIEVKDHDFVCGAHDGINSRGEIIDRLSEAAKNGEIDNLKIASDKENPKKDGEIIAAIMFEHDGRPIDLKIVLGPVTAQQMAVYGDAPINCIAFDVDKPEDVYMHPRTEEDLKNKVWTVRVKEAHEIDASVSRHAEVSRRPGNEGLLLSKYGNLAAPNAEAPQQTQSGRKLLSLPRNRKKPDGSQGPK